MSRIITRLHIRAINASTPVARLHIGDLVFPCLIGRMGMTTRKREGDGKSPIGFWRIEAGYFRADRVNVMRKLKAIRREDGWCDDPLHRQYNRLIRLPFNASHEEMRRSDSAYDIVFTTNHNLRPRIRGGGSAIFFHLIAPGATSTAGCVAVSKGHMMKILQLCRGPMALVIGVSGGPQK